MIINDNLFRGWRPGSFSKTEEDDASHEPQTWRGKIHAIKLFRIDHCCIIVVARSWAQIANIKPKCHQCVQCESNRNSKNWKVRWSKRTNFGKKNILHVITDKNSHRGSLKRTFLPQYKIPGNASTEYLNKSWVMHFFRAVWTRNFLHFKI